MDEAGNRMRGREYSAGPKTEEVPKIDLLFVLVQMSKTDPEY